MILENYRLTGVPALASLLLVQALALAGPAAAQLGALEVKKELADRVPTSDVDPEAPVGPNLSEQNTFEDEIVVIEVEIPVQVLVDGSPVRGLGRDNFEIWERGEQRQIIAFEAIDLSTSITDAEPSLERGAQPDSRESPESASDSVLPERHFLALFDFVNARGYWITRSVKSVRRMLDEQLHPTDRMAIATMGQNGAVLLLGFTDDRQKLSVALDMVQATADRNTKAYRRARLAMTRDQRQSLDELAASMGAPAAIALGGSLALLDMPSPEALGADLNRVGFMEADSQIAAEAVEAFEIGATLETGARLSELRLRFQSLQRLVTLLRGVSGQRYLLNFSAEQGDFQAAVSGGELSRDSKSTLTGPGLLASFHDLVSEFRRSGWVIHSFNLQGVPAAGGVTADGPSLTGAPATLMNSGSLFYLANETGGRLYENYNRIDVATERMLEQTSVTYRLIFQAPDLRRNGDYHDVDVRVVSSNAISVPGKAKVVARKGFYAPRPDRKLSDVERLMAETEQLFYGADEVEVPGTLNTLVAPMADGRRRAVLIVDADLNPFLDELQDGPTRVRAQVEIQALALCQSADAAAPGNGEPASDPSQYRRADVADMFREMLELPWRDQAERIRHGFRFVGDLTLPREDQACSVRLRLRPRTQRNRSRPGLLASTTLPPKTASRDASQAVGYLVSIRPREAALEAAAFPYLAREQDSLAVQDPNSPLVHQSQVLLPAIEPRVDPSSQLGVVFRIYGPADETALPPRFVFRDRASGTRLPAQVSLEPVSKTADGVLFLGLVEIASLVRALNYDTSAQYELVIEWADSGSPPGDTVSTVELPFSVAAPGRAGG